MRATLNLMRWSEDQLADYLKRRGVAGQPNTMDVSDPPFGIGPSIVGAKAAKEANAALKRHHFALGRLPAGAMNKTEAEYSRHLDRQQHDGMIFWHKFEGLKLRLADSCFYTPDFAVMAADGVIECHEVKGFWMDDARAKIKIAASLYPFRFKAMKVNPKKHGGGWQVEEF